MNSFKIGLSATLSGRHAIQGRESLRGIKLFIGELRASPLLAGSRRRSAVSLGGIVQAAKAVAHCVMEWDDIAEIEVNPLFAYGDRAVPADARVVLSPP